MIITNIQLETKQQQCHPTTYIHCPPLDTDDGYAANLNQRTPKTEVSYDNLERSPISEGLHTLLSLGHPLDIDDPVLYLLGLYNKGSKDR